MAMGTLAPGAHIGSGERQAMKGCKGSVTEIVMAMGTLAPGAHIGSGERQAMKGCKQSVAEAGIPLRHGIPLRTCI